MPPVSAITTCSNWRRETEELLFQAVQTLVRDLPTLAGRLVQMPNGEVLVKPNHFEMSDLYIYIDGSRLTASDLPSISPAEYALGASPEAIAKDVCSDIGSGIYQLSHGSPLFSFTVIRLEGSRACYVLQLSRVIGSAKDHSALINLLKRHLVQHYCRQRAAFKPHFRKQAAPTSTTPR
eukprot:337895-Pleurochrysis_carterae.AAC.1